jgi:hypothetical protein
MISIVLENRSAQLSLASLTSYQAAWTVMLNQHLRWGWPALPEFSLQIGTTGAPSTYGVIFQDGIAVAGDMGYHDEETGLPIAHVDVAGTLADGYTVSDVGGHELAEMAVDPAVTNIVRGAWGQALAECCDSFIMPGMTYNYGGIELPNFTTQAYWGLGACSRLDMRGLLTTGQLFPYLPEGGYATVMGPGASAWAMTHGAFVPETPADVRLAATRRMTMSARCAVLVSRNSGSS